VVYHNVYNIIYLPTQCTNLYDFFIKLTYTKMPSARCWGTVKWNLVTRGGRLQVITENTSMEHNISVYTYIYLICYIIILYRCTLVDIVGAPKLSVRGYHNPNGLDPDCRRQYLHWHLFRQKSRGVYNIAYHMRII